jgi:hypothetical protein
MSDTGANLSFLPWVRQGAAAGIATADDLTATQAGVAQLQIGLSLNGAAAQAVTARLRGPADVVGISASQVVRLEPPPGSADFEPNYFPCIEFDGVDLPWLFTPLGPGAEAKLRPWLCLLTVQVQDGIAIAPAAGAPLPQLEIASPATAADELPDLSESWAWAHAQVASGDSAASSVSAALSGGSQLSLARLISPRRLAANTDYLACVVPTFEIGRKAGLGLAIDPSELNGLAPAWSFAAGTSGEIVLPVYYSWSFRTGANGDFTSLAQRLTARPAPDGVGERPVDIGQPGFTLPATFPKPAVTNLGGALQPTDAPETDPSWPDGAEAPFQAGLAPIVNAPGQGEAADPDADPILAPPLYGRWYAARATAAPGGASWFDELNLDPRWRAVAALGVGVVQANQEALMASAWRQAADLRQANQRVRQLQLSVTVGADLHARHLGALDGDGVLRVAAPAFGRLRTTASPTAQPRTVFAQLSDTAVPLAATGAAMRRIVRARGPVTRRAVAIAIAKTATLASPVAAGPTSAAPPATTPAAPVAPVAISRNWFNGLNLVLGGARAAPPPAGMATVTAVLAQMGGTPAIRPYAAVTAALVAAAGPEPFFTVVAEGQPVHVSHPPPTAFGTTITDSPSAAAFRQAAEAHLGRVDPGRGAPAAKTPAAFDLDAFRATVLTGLDPRATIPALARAVIEVAPAATAPVGTPASAMVGIDTVMMAPTFPQPMYEPLSVLSQDLLLPSLETVPPDSVIGLKTNRRFVETYMIGLNTEMGGELLWRGFPTDQRGTYFSQFWDTRGAPQPRPDIDPPSTWGDRPLGQESGASGTTAEQFVMLMRGALVQRYPNAVIYAVKAVKSNGFRTPSTAPADETYPIFTGALQPDLFFFGFPLAGAAVTGADGSDGCYIVIQEHPTQPRFGLDASLPVTGANLSVAAGPPDGLSAQGLQWGHNGAHMAGIVRRPPTRVAIHGSRLASAVQASPS